MGAQAREPGGSRPVRLLTGATDGIGLELARIWQARGEPAYLHGRRSREELDPELFTEEAYLRADLTQTSAPDRIAEALAERGVERLDRLVLNAGTGWTGPIGSQTEESVRELVEVNLISTMRLCRLLLPWVARAGGRVAYVSSISAGLPCPDYAVYGASKAACEGFLRSLRAELEGTVEVQVIRPGAVRTAIHAKSGFTPEEIGWERFPPATRVARRIDALLSGPPRWRTIGTANRVVFALGRNLPRTLDRSKARARRRRP